MIRVVVFAVFASLLSGVSGSEKNDLALQWQVMARAAQTEAMVTVASSHTGHFGGVATRTCTSAPKFADGRDGDAALALYHSTAKAFHGWAKATGAKSSTTNGSRGEMSLRVKAANGDYFSVLYQPPAEGVETGDVTFVFVDASEFLVAGR